MIILVTNQCHAGCSHCMQESTPKSGQHMTLETFSKSLDLTARLENMAWMLGTPPLVWMSGGECTEHPEILALIEQIEARGWIPGLVSNGYWLNNDALRDEILRPGRTIFAQITHDARFYPGNAPPRLADKRLFYNESLLALLPLGRALRKKGLADLGLPLKKAPSSFNLRSMTRSMKSIELAIAELRLRSINGRSGMCIPTISHEGHVLAGETRSCFRIGTVDSTNQELTDALIGMRCNNCGLVNNLTQEQKRAIGESSIFGANE